MAVGGRDRPTLHRRGPTPLPPANASHRHRKGNHREKNPSDKLTSQWGQQPTKPCFVLGGDEDRAVAALGLDTACPRAALRGPEGRGQERQLQMEPVFPTIRASPGTRGVLCPLGLTWVPLAVLSAIAPAKQIPLGSLLQDNQQLDGDQPRVRGESEPP